MDYRLFEIHVYYVWIVVYHFDMYMYIRIILKMFRKVPTLSYFEKNRVLGVFKQESVGIVPSNYCCMLETLTFYMDINFYIFLCMCHKMIVIILKYHSR